MSTNASVQVWPWENTQGNILWRVYKQAFLFKIIFKKGHTFFYYMGQIQP